MRARAIMIVAAVFVFSIAALALADDLGAGKDMIASGDKAGAAAFFNRYAAEHPDDAKTTPEALAYCGRLLDLLADSITGDAEKRCYWVKGGGMSPQCMEKEARMLEAKFGEGAFRFEPQLNYLYYSGAHYRKILDRFPKSEYATEAQFYLLLHNLVGDPKEVLARVKDFVSKQTKGVWNRRAGLLWARINEDIWTLYRKQGFAIVNRQLSPDDLVIKAEPYRQEALKVYERLLKERDTFEGKAAGREYALLIDNKDDGIFYGVASDSTPGTLVQWGVELPAMVNAPDAAPAPVPPKKRQ